MVSWFHGVMVSWCHGVMVSWCHSVMVLRRKDFENEFIDNQGVTDLRLVQYALYIVQQLKHQSLVHFKQIFAFHDTASTFHYFRFWVSGINSKPWSESMGGAGADTPFLKMHGSIGALDENWLLLKLDRFAFPMRKTRLLPKTH